jgi:hypothetical protein
MKTGKAGKVDLQEFVEFLAAEPATPRPATNEAVYRHVRKSLRPPLWAVLGKLTLVQAVAGLGTLALCPQFEIGLGAHHEALHLLHAWTGPLLHYLACGSFFVLVGAILGGALLRRGELQVLGRQKYLYFLAYSLAAFAVFVALGAEVFLVGSLLWMTGAVLGHILGFSLGTKLRTALS